jgi:hypothetical protein
MADFPAFVILSVASRFAGANRLAESKDPYQANQSIVIQGVLPCGFLGIHVDGVA